LASGIPNLQLDALAIQLDRSYLEVDTDGGYEGGSEGIFAETQQTTRFTDSGIAYEEELYLDWDQWPWSRLGGWVC
jgi:hypothetical protein